MLKKYFNKWLALYSNLEIWVVAIFSLLLSPFLMYVLGRAFDFRSAFFSLLVFIATVILVCFSYCSRTLKKKETAEVELKYKLELDEAQQAITDLRATSIKDAFEISSNYLRNIAASLEMNHFERVSIYYHNQEKKHCYLVARFSKNPEYCRQHREAFSDNEGVLGLCCQHGESKLFSLPFEDNLYYKACQNQKINKKCAEQFSMKSRFLLPIPIEDRSTQIGIFLFEKTVQSQLEWEEIKKNGLESENTLRDYISTNESFFIDLIRFYDTMYSRSEPIKRENEGR